MAEKFDVEFRKKVRGINPEIPEIVKKRIEDTLASLPERKNVPRRIYSTVAAALILICIAGLGYKAMISSPNKSAARPESRIQVAADKAPTQDKQNGSFGIQAADSAENTKENDGTSEPAADKNVSIKASKDTVGKASTGQVAAASPQTANTVAKMADSTNNGVNVELKSASYDGKQITVQFVKSGTDSTSGTDTVRSLIKTEDKYDMDIIINSIPLKCSISLKDVPSSSNQYTGEFVITPESPLPDEFEMGVLFKQLGDVSGQWEVYGHIKKDGGN